MLKGWLLGLSMLCVVLGCGVGTAPGTPAPDVPDTIDPVDVVDVCEVCEVCDDPTDPSPEILHLRLDPAPGNPLAAVLSFQTSEPVTWALMVAEAVDERAWTLAVDQPAAAVHVVPVLGLRPGRSYQMTLEVTDGAGNLTTGDLLDWQTDPLPEGFPRVTVLEGPAEDLPPGLTLLNLIRWGGDVLNQGLLVVLDDQGEVVWIHEASETLVEARRTAHGTFVVAFGESDGIREIDMLGNTLHEWRPADLGLDSLHHAVASGPGDSILSLATELRWIDGYAMEDGTPVGYPVVGDLAVELPREGAPVHSWSLLDVLDPYHFNPGFFTAFWFLLYPDAPGGAKDWSHGNAIQYDPEDDSYVVSLANQDLVVKLARGTGAKIWALGESGDIPLDEGGTWFSVPHGVEWTSDGRVVLYDDGVFKPERRSRIVEYTMTESPEGLRTAAETWSWDGGEDPFYCMGPADVDLLPDDNLLVLHGSLVEHPEASPFGSGNRLWVRLEILRRDPIGERLLALDIGGPSDPLVKNITSFAAERLSSLYPPGWEMEAVEISSDIPCEKVCAESDCGWIRGCVCGICFPTEICLDGRCADCFETCMARNHVCGLLDLSCNCGDCPQSFLCDERGECVDEALLCAPFCEGRECGLVGAFYLGQSCDCGTCPVGMVCSPSTATCI